MLLQREQRSVSCNLAGILGQKYRGKFLARKYRRSQCSCSHLVWQRIWAIVIFQKPKVKSIAQQH